MPGLMNDEVVERFGNVINLNERIGVSEFARSKDWRDRLSDCGCLEVSDRSGVVGYMLSPEYALALKERIALLEDQLERAQVAAMFDIRSGYDDVRTGQELKEAVEDVFEKRIDSLMDVFNGD